MMSDVEPAEIAPLVQYKSCGLCVRKFPIEALTGSVSVASMSVLLSKWHLSVAKFNARLESSNLSKYHRISLCVFCAQFFDGPSAQQAYRPVEDEDGMGLLAGHQQATGLFDPVLDIDKSRS